MARAGASLADDGDRAERQVAEGAGKGFQPLWLSASEALLEAFGEPVAIESREDLTTFEL